MNEKQAILKDLQKYLKKMGIKSIVKGSGFMKIKGANIYIKDGGIHNFFGEIVSLANPRYREDFYIFILPFYKGIDMTATRYKNKNWYENK